MPSLAKKKGAKLPHIESVDTRVATAEEEAAIAMAFKRLIAALVEQHLAPDSNTIIYGGFHDQRSNTAQARRE